MQTPIGPSTQSNNLRLALLVNLIPVVLLGWVTITQFLQPSHEKYPLFANPWFLSAVEFCYLYVLIGLYRQWRFSRHLAKVRQHLFSSAVSRPSTLEFHVGEMVSPITLRYKRRAIWFGIIVILAVLLPPTLDLAMGGSRQIASEGFFSSMISSLFIVAFEGGFVLFLLVAWLKTSQTVWATNQGLTIEKKDIYYLRENITWQEIQLFACYKKPTVLWRRGATMTYELSNQEKILTWLYLCDTTSFFAVWKPLLSSDRYHQQMQKLCEVVKEKTGLALQDISQPGHK